MSLSLTMSHFFTIVIVKKNTKDDVVGDQSGLMPQVILAFLLTLKYL